jgi:hypothetical protein
VTRTYGPRVGPRARLLAHIDAQHPGLPAKLRRCGSLAELQRWHVWVCRRGVCEQETA